LALRDKFKSKPRPEKKKGGGYKGWTAVLEPINTANYWSLHFIDPEGKRWNWTSRLYAKSETEAIRQARKHLRNTVEGELEKERQAARKRIVL
jgi:hypothetical protein